MPIPIKKNPNYGGNLINQKYSPLNINSVDIDETAQKEYKALFDNRIQLLSDIGLLPSALWFYTENWPKVITQERSGNPSPPIIVISSNRAEWIKTIDDLANNIQEENYSNISDLKALCAGPT